MNSFKNIREKFGQETLVKVRDLEKTTKSLARYRNHLVFTLRCRDENITPPSLMLKCPIKTDNARKIVQKARKSLLNERIRENSRKVDFLKEAVSGKKEQLCTVLPSDSDVTQVLDLIEISKEREYKQTKWRHTQKLERWKERKSALDRKEEPDLSGTLLKKFVKNISDKQLTASQTKVLAKGLNFAVSPDTIPVQDFVVATEKACLLLNDDSEKEQIRAEVTGLLKKAKPPATNLSKEERRALNELKKDKDLTILPADKGKATVVMNVTSYDEKVNLMLSDERTYEKLKKDPTPVFKRKLVNLLTRFKQEDKITEGQYRHLYPTSENIPRMYCTPKIHKEGNPLRPIVDYTGSIGYNCSRALADLLGPLVGLSEHHVKNSKDLAEKMSEILIEEDEIFASHDVVSLFTNTPINKALQVIRDRLEKDSTLKKRTLLQANDIMELCEFILTTTYFQFRGNIFQQKFGTAMGSPVSPIVANLYMEWLENEAIATAPINCQPQLWKRYVDDVLEKIKEGETQNLTDHLNTIDATNSIKFTHEEENSGTIPFLDTLIVRKPDKTVKLLVYRKKTHTDQYLHFTSHHPLQHKLGVIRTLLDRCSDIVTEENDRVKEEEHIVEALGKCGYPKWSFQKVKKQMKEKEEKKKTNKAKTKNQDKDNSKGLVILPYIKGLTESITRVFKKHKVSTAIKPMQTIRNILVHPKDKQDKLEKSEIVYKIPCKTCDKVYIGETGRKLATRLKEHSKDVEQNRKETFTRSSRKQSLTEFNKSAITDHVNQNNHIIDWEGTRVIDRESDYKTRVIKEAIHIRMSKEVMNRDEGAHQLPRVYDPIFVTECDENHKA